MMTATAMMRTTTMILQPITVMVMVLIGVVLELN